MTYWAEGYKKSYPNVNIQIEGKGSSTAPPALIEGTSQLGPHVARDEGEPRSTRFEAKYGYKPTRVRVALDGLAVYVNKDNPIEKLTFKQVDGDLLVDPEARRQGRQDLGRPGPYGRLGVEADLPLRTQLAPRAPTATSRSTRSRTATTRTASRSSRAPPRSSRASRRTSTRSATRESATRPRASRPFKLSAKDGGPFFGESYENVLSGKYPLARYLNVYVNKAPDEGARPAREAVSPFRPLEGRTGDRRQGRLLPPHGEGRR